MRRRVLITGGSGFLGQNVVRAWCKTEAEVTSLSRSSRAEHPDHIACDLSRCGPDLKSHRFDTVVHCAGVAHVEPRNESEANEFFRGNVEGTKNLLSSLEDLDEYPNRIIFISSVAVYGRTEGTDIGETSPLDGKTPYAKSKIQTEELVANAAARHKTDYLILRLPLVAGYDPPGNLGKMAASIQRGTYVRIRNNRARKSIVLADDVAQLTVRLDSGSGTYNLTDKIDPEFCEIEDAISESIDTRIRRQIPKPFMKAVGRIGSSLSLRINNGLYEKITSTLTYSSDLAAIKLGWEPGSCLDFIKRGGLFQNEI